jgi:hypothetical protein
MLKERKVMRCAGAGLVPESPKRCVYFVMKIIYLLSRFICHKTPVITAENFFAPAFTHYYFFARVAYFLHCLIQMK